MTTRNTTRVSLYVKVITAVAVVLVGVLGLATYAEWRDKRATLERQLGDEAHNVNAVLDAALNNAMMKSDQEELETSLNRAAGIERMKSVYILSTQGKRLRAAGGDVPPEADAASLALLRQSPGGLYRIRETAAGRGFMQGLSPILAETGCLQCHDEVKAGEPLGYLGVERWADEDLDHLRQSLVRSIATSALAAVATFAVLLLIIRGVIRPIREMAGAAAQIAVGDVQQSITHHGNDEIGQLADSFRTMVAYLRDAAAAADALGRGDLQAKVEPRGADDRLHQSMLQLRTTLGGLASEMDRLTAAAQAGDLSVRGRTEDLRGEYRRIVEGVNATLDAVVTPLRVAAECVDQISKGDIPPRITQAYNGDFRALGDNLNQCIDAIEAMVADVGILCQAAVTGRLATRARSERHQGEFRRIVQGMNDTLDAVIGPLNVAAEYVDRISKGDIPPKITDTYLGDFNEIKNNLNQCIEAVHLLVNDAAMLSAAAVQGQLATRAQADRHQGDFRAIVQGVNDTLDAVIGPLGVAAEYVENISRGHIPPKITATYYGDFNEIKNNLNQCIDAVNGLVTDTRRLSTAAVAGQLTERADVSRHQGDFAKIVQGINDTLDAVIGPLHVAAGYVDRISKGDIPPHITQTYSGDFDALRNNLNTCIDAVNALVADAHTLARAAVAGHLATRADASRHQGDFAKIVQGVNDTLDAVVGPLNVAAGCVDRISKGDIPPAITDDYQGDFGALKTNLNQCIAAVNALVTDAAMLAQAAVAGQLATRADVSRHQGDFRRIVQGVNDTLDAVIGPLNIAAGYVDRISRGDIPPRIADTYNGDFQAIRDNLNTCIDAVANLVADTATLARAAVEGRLGTRADAARHQGDFARIVQGVNDTLDAVIGPLSVAAGYVDRISKGDIPPPITAKYNGDFNAIKDNLNTCIDAINALIADAGMLSAAAVDGRLATRADASRHQGDFRTIVQGVNGTLDAVIGPLNVAARYVDCISRGDIPAPITDTYAGDFNTLRNNLNTCIEAVKALVSDARRLADAAVAGQLETRADANRHQGDFRKIVQGVNDTLDAVIGPLHVAARYVDRISKGDIPPPITERYSGDFNAIKDNLNTCIEAVNALVADAQALSAAAVAGHLSTRADTSRHQGDFRRIVEGVNATLDAVIIPLNVAAGYVDRISKGDIPPKITDDYQGDFNAIKTNLNTCIEAVNLLVADAHSLSAAAVAGQLAARADATRHQGEFRTIVQGVNDTLDAVIGPLNVAAAYVDRISRGDIPPKIADSYSGDFNAIKDNLNTCIGAVNALVADAGMLVRAAAAGQLATRADTRGHQGDFRRIVEGVNDTLDAVLEPINEAAAVLAQVAAKDLTARVQGTYNGDLAKIKESLNTAVANLDGGLTQVGLASEQVSSAGSSIAGSSHTLAEGASEQASSLEEISSSLEQMASMTQQNSDNSDQAKSLAQRARDSAEKGITAMARMSTAIDRIKTSSDQTAKIVKTIDEIAFQTNLLALNAAVEAARAGEAGKGFAVVAEEVRNLAQRSAQAAKSTADMIAEAVHNAEQGVEVSEDVAAILREITQGANHVNALVAEIAAASKEQATGIGQVNSAVTQLDKVTQQNAANAEGSASAAAELNAQADELRDLLATYRLTRSRRSPDDGSRATARRPGASTGAAAGEPAASPRAARPSPESAAAPPPMPPPAPGEAAMDEGVFHPF